MGTGSWCVVTGAALALVATLGGSAWFDLREPPAPGSGLLAPSALQSRLDVEEQPFRIVADLDGDAVPDTFGYSPEPPWHTVRFASRSRSWEAQPGEGLEELFAPVNEQMQAEAVAHEPDAAKRQAWLERYRICADNVEHGPVLAVGGRLVVMWYMEPLYPAGINTYDLEGRLLSRYVHPGHLRCMTASETRAGTILVFGGTNNFLDREPAIAAGRKALHLPIVGAIALGEDGLDPALATALSGPREARAAIAQVPFYEVVDRARNSQVVHVRTLETGCRFAVEYEPGSTVDGGYAAQQSTAIVHLCGTSSGNSGACAVSRPRESTVSSLTISVAFLTVG